MLANDISKNKIEERGATTLKYRISKIENLREDIKYNEKTQCFDGVIKLYSGNPDKKENLLDDNLPVQIKTTTTSKQNKEKVSVQTEDMVIFQRMGGVIYFQIYANGNSEDVFYKVFLPIELNRYLNNKVTANQKSFTFKFKYLSESKFYDLWRICKDFSDNKKRQMSFKDSLIDTEKLALNNKEFKIYSSFDNNTKVEDLIGDEFPTYTMCKIADTDVPIPVNLGVLSQIKINPIYDVKINDKIYYNSIEHIVSETEDTFIIGKSFHYNRKTNKIKIKLHGTLDERIKSLEFILDLIKYNGECNFINYNELPDTEVIKEYERLYLAYKEIRKILNDLNINKDLEFDILDEKSFRDLYYLRTYFIKNKRINFKSETTFLLDMKLANISILLFIEKHNDGFTLKNMYDYDDAFKYSFSYGENGESSLKHRNKFLILKESNLLCDNFNSINIIQSFDEMEYNENSSIVANTMLLEMIKAYDTSKNIKYIECAQICFEKLINHDDNIIFKINQWQIFKRLNILNNKNFIEIKEEINKNTDNSILWALYLLLDDEKNSKICYNKLSDEEKEFFSKTPISIYYINKNI